MAKEKAILESRPVCAQCGKPIALEKDETECEECEGLFHDGCFDLHECDVDEGESDSGDDEDEDEEKPESD